MCIMLNFVWGRELTGLLVNDMAHIEDIQEARLKDEILRRLAEEQINISELTKKELASLENEIKMGVIPGVNALDGVLHWAYRRIERKKHKKEFNKIISAAKAIKIIIALLLATLLVGCAERKVTIENRAIVSIAPLKPIVEAILGDDFEVEVLVPAGASPETFELTPKQLREVESARFVFGTGLLAFEQELLHRIARNNQVVNTSQGIELIAGTCSHAHNSHATCSHGHAHGVDPHIWCSPKALRTIAENSYKAIHTTLPDSTKYEARYTALCEQLLELDEEVTEMCRYSPHGYFIIFHPALTYLARDYNLEQVALEDEGKEPSVRRLAQVINRARRDGVKRIFYQSEFPRHSVEAVCRDAGAEPTEINPLCEDIFNNIRNITRLITE